MFVLYCMYVFCNGETMRQGVLNELFATNMN